MKIPGLMLCAALAGLTSIATGQAATPAAGGTAAPPAARFVQPQPDLVKDTRTGLLWAQSDNGLDATWPQAVNYCKRKGSGWRLPSAGELQSLRDETQSVACGRWRCGVSPMLRLSGPWFWSNERMPASEAEFVNLTSGSRSSTHVGNRNGLQALCVRRAGPQAGP